MIFPLSARLLLATLAVVGAAQSAALSPDVSSDAVLAARTDPQGELRVTYQKDVDGRQRQVLTVGLAREYDYVQTPAERTIRDYRLRRVFRYQPAFASAYINDSLFAEAWYRAAEVQRRSQQVGAVKEAGAGPQKGLLTLSPFWAESELGVATRSFPRAPLSRNDQVGRSSWMLGRLEVLAVRWHEQPVPAEVQGGLRRLWFVLAPVHPQIVEDLAAAGRMPDELWVEAPAPDGRHLQRLHWVLSGYEWIPAATYPLAAHLRAVPTESAGAYPEIFGTLSVAVARRLQPPAERVYVDRIQSAVSQGEGLQALLWLQEMRLAQDSSSECLPNDRRPACALMQVATSLAENDPRTDLAFGQQSPAPAQRAVFGDLPNAYLLGLLWATRPSGAKVTFAESEQDVLEALKASPVAGFCKDAGDFYADAWKAKAAWQIWDLGRLMAGHRKGDVLEQIDALETRLVQDYPGMF